MVTLKRSRNIPENISQKYLATKISITLETIRKYDSKAKEEENVMLKFSSKQKAKFEILKCWKLFHCHYKLLSNLLSNPRGGFMAPEAKKIKKKTFNKKTWELQKISIIFRVYVCSIKTLRPENGHKK